MALHKCRKIFSLVTGTVRQGNRTNTKQKSKIANRRNNTVQFIIKTYFGLR